jgi:hypothetical protein
MWISSNENKICQWCHKDMSPKEVINVTVKDEEDDHTYNFPVCSEYCKNRYLYKRDNFDDFDEYQKDRSKLKCKTCFGNTQCWGFIYKPTGDYYCSGLHLDIYESHKIDLVINKKQEILSKLQKINKEISNFEEEIKLNF